MEKFQFDGTFEDFKKTTYLYRKLNSRGGVGYLYAFQIGGHVKIGKSTDIIKRIYDHNRSAFFYAQKEIERISVFGIYENLNQAELDLRSSFYSCPSFRRVDLEWFSGSLDGVVKLFPT
jgi:hypothetical protein